MTDEKDVYLLLGPENGQKNQFIKNKIKSIYTKIHTNPEIYRIYPFEKSMVEVIALLQNRILFSPHKVVILNNVEELKIKNDIKLLCDYCKNTAEDTTLFLISDTVNKVDKSIKEVVDKKKQIIFWELIEDRKQGWIINFFRKKGL